MSDTKPVHIIMFKHYACNWAVKPKQENSTKIVEKVTCNNCLRILRVNKQKKELSK